ncbi:MAG: hypothetical protein O3A95_08405 [Planctomycetota bacterium]|nr:hypothetical protein [Planctomycetota bacterium]MDA1114302.1 hypothetical protein [Planctomycetota bacterium]
MSSFTRCEMHPSALCDTVECCEELYVRTRASEPPIKDERETRIWRSPTVQAGNAEAFLFFKEYRIPGTRFWFSGAARSRASREFRALLAMDLANLPVAKPDWFAESRKGPFLKSSVLVTQCLGPVEPFSDWLRARVNEEGVTLPVCAMVGGIARKLHDLGFGHFRMQAKNFMVCGEGELQVKMIDVPYTCRWQGAVGPRIRKLDLEDLCGAHSVFSPAQTDAVLQAYHGFELLGDYRPGLRSRWGQKLRRIAYYLGAIWSGHRP